MNLSPKNIISLLKQVFVFDSVGVKVVNGRDVMIVLQNPRRR